MGIKDFFRISDDQWGLGTEHLEGIKGYSYKDYIGLEVKRAEECVEFENLNKQKILLPFKQIISVNFITWEKTLVKDLNPLAEGIVGGLIGGSTMAVVSAIDAKGRTRSEKVKVEGAIEIQYHPQGDSRAIERIVVDPGHPKSMGEKWAKTLCRCAGLPEPRHIEPEAKGPTYL